MIRWSGPAHRDLAGIDAYYRSRDPGFANSISREALNAARFLADNPFAGAPVDARGARKWPVRTTPFILLYRPAREAIYILRVQHSRQNWRLP